jgi:branched-chain amino acid transport system ATP-binding protein
MSEVFLELEGVTAGYHGQAVVREVSLRVTQGAAVAIIGPNGHGKTTLLRCISGLIPMMGGSITAGGRSIGGVRPEKIVELGLVHIPQGDLVFPEMSVVDNLMMGAYLPAAYAKAGEQLQTVLEIFPQLDERKRQVASTLSGGERRMLALGRGLMTGGRLLMIDEPSLGLAPIAVEQIYGVIRALKEDGRTILIVEENVSRVMNFADYIYLLDHGEFVWQGGADDLKTNPQILSTYLGA